MENQKKTLTEIMARPLPDITPEQERELAQLEESMSKSPTEDPRSADIKNPGTGRTPETNTQ